MKNKIPITVGIIGHLDAIITDKHKKIIRQIFDDINNNYPNSPVVLFSQLAKGADTKIAKQFVEIKEETNRDYQLIVPLPFDEKEYKKAFTQTELADYNSLISKAERSFVIENTDKLETSELYRNGGKFVADSSIILIAIWNKDDNDKKGGTADIVRYKIEGSFKDEVETHIFDLNGSLIELECNRESSKEKKEIILEYNQFDKLLFDKSINKALRKIEDFNIKFKNIDKIKYEQDSNNFYPNDKTLIKPNEILKNIYCSIDNVTILQQKSYRNWMNFFFAFGIVILFVFEIYKHKGLHPWLFTATILLIFSAFRVYKYSVRNESNHRQFIEDRVIAESLRIQFFWNISDIKKVASNHILRIHKTEYNWIKHILSSVYGYTYNGENTRDETIEDVKKYWIENQKNWFTKKIKTNKNKQHSYNNWSKIFFWSGIVTLFLIAFLEHKHFDEGLIHWLVVVDSVIFGVYALSKAYIEKQGFEQMENQYNLMKSVYKSTEKKMNDIENTKASISSKEKQLDKLLFLAGKEALIENGNWYLIFKDKEPEVELGG